MKLVILISALIFTSASPALVHDDNSEVVPQSAIDYINSVQSSWVASKSWVGSMTLAEARTYSRPLLAKSFVAEYNWGAILDHFTAPASFDSRVQWPNCVHPILDEGQCGSDWALAATESLSDRFCIATSGSTNVTLSPQYLLDCDKNDNGCMGGWPIHAWNFMLNTGLPTTTCFPYVAKDFKCPSKCNDGSNFVFYKAANVNSFPNTASIQAALISGGPIETTFTLYQDFYSYSSGVYVHTWGSTVGEQSVKFVGWGVSGNQNYWICSNSWSTSWGIQGYFWIAFGQCSIEQNGIGGNPAI